MTEKKDKGYLNEVERKRLYSKVQSQILSFNPTTKKVKPMYEGANEIFPNPDIDKINDAVDKANAKKKKK